VASDLGSSNHQPLPPERGKMTKKHEIATDSDVHYKQAKHAIRKALQMSKQSTQQDEIENVRRTLNAL
jgi:hypothetical protein